MTLAAPVTLREYTRMAFDGHDPEFVNGELVERGMPTKSHATITYLLCILFLELVKQGRLRVYPELRLLLSEQVARIPDFCAFVTEPEGELPATPPLLTVEVVSPDDRFTELLKKAQEYAEFGVQHIWVIDPGQSLLFQYEQGTLARKTALELPEFGFRITAADLLLA
jgi:Uma2 family endonuclease